MSDDTGEPAVENKIFSDEQQGVIDQMLEKQAETLTSQLTSHFGRISKEQVNKSFNEKVDPDKLNEDLSNKMFGGDVNGTVRDIIKAVNREETDLASKKTEALRDEMKKFEGTPLFKETSKEVEKIAQEALSKGYPPAPAVELAFATAKNNYFANSNPDLKLGMSGSGGQSKQQKKSKIPTELKDAAARDISDGIFKDEADYLANMPSSLKEKYGI